MGERKGQNKYYPPEFFHNPKIMSRGLDAFHGSHPLRERGKKAHLGILIIRFEMPYNIWCNGCKNHIGMGVRYNAEKKKIGSYYSTPIYEFKMKCHLCDNYFVIKTDPANLDYTIVSGARRQENRWDATQNEQIVPDTKETQHRLYDDAMFKLEHELNDKKTSHKAKGQLSKIYSRNDAVWDDNFEANSKLRESLRNSKAGDNEILSRTSLSGLKLLPENEEDRRFASYLKFQSKKLAEEKKDTSESLKEGVLRQKWRSFELGIVKKKTVVDLMERGEEQPLGGGLSSLVSAYSSSSDSDT